MAGRRRPEGVVHQGDYAGFWPDGKEYGIHWNHDYWERAGDTVGLTQTTPANREWQVVVMPLDALRAILRAIDEDQEDQHEQ